MTKKELERMPLLAIIAVLFGVLLAKGGLFVDDDVSFHPNKFKLVNTVGDFDVSYTINNSSNKTLKRVSIVCTSFFTDGTSTNKYISKNIILDPFRTSKILSLEMYAPKPLKEVQCKVFDKFFLD